MNLILQILTVLSFFMMIIFMSSKRKRRRNAKLYLLVIVLYCAVQLSLVIFHIQNSFMAEEAISEIQLEIKELEDQKKEIESEIKEIEKTNNVSQTYESTVTHKEEIREIEKKIEDLNSEISGKKILNKRNLEVD